MRANADSEIFENKDRLSGDPEENVIRQMSYDWKWLECHKLTRLRTIHRKEALMLWDDIEEYDENYHLSRVIEAIEESFQNQKDLRKLYHEDKEKLEQSLEFEFYLLTEKIWVINDHCLLPFEKRILCKWTLDIINSLFKWWWTLSIWTNSYLVPWSLQTLTRLTSKRIVDPKDIHIKFWKWVNIQENISLLKVIQNWREWFQSINKFEREIDSIDDIHIHIWDNSSIAHWCSIYWERSDNWHYRIRLHAWRWVFLWINSIIWSWSDLWDKTTLWWWSKLGMNVKTGKNVIIWQWANIKDWVIIPENCIVLDWAHISPWYELIDFDEYKKHEVEYDITKINEKRKRNFVIRLSSRKDERISQIWALWDAYVQMAIFNKAKVTPENKAFSVVDAILRLLEDRIDWFEISKNIRFKNNHIAITQEIENLFYSKDKDEKESRNSELYLQWYPKDKVNFLLEDILPVLKRILNWEKIDSKEINKLINYPDIPVNFGEIFLWYNSIIWNVSISSNPENLIYECSWRKDENSDKDRCRLDWVMLARCVFHWPWDQIFKDTIGLRTCFHWKILSISSTVWERWYPSTFNNAEIRNSKAYWRCTVNNAIIEDSQLWFASTISPTPMKKVYIIADSKLHDDCTIRWNNTLENFTLYPHSFIWEPSVRMHRKNWNLSGILTPNTT